MRILRMILRTLKESIRNIFRQGWLSFSAILSIVVTLVLTSLLLVVSVNVEQTTKSVAQGLQTLVYLEAKVTDA
ncbi:MAG: permease-like cell division protein FtsX, partial [Culicoidibacterales bacterium]